MKEGFSVSTTIKALQFLIPCPVCDELVVRGDDCPSWPGFTIWLNKRVFCSEKWLIPI